MLVLSHLASVSPLPITIRPHLLCCLIFCMKVSGGSESWGCCGREQISLHYLAHAHNHACLHDLHIEIVGTQESHYNHFLFHCGIFLSLLSDTLDTPTPFELVLQFHLFFCYHSIKEYLFLGAETIYVERLSHPQYSMVRCRRPTCRICLSPVIVPPFSVPGLSVFFLLLSTLTLLIHPQ